MVLSGYTPTGLEQEFLERLNDARANPTAYGQSIGVDLSYIAPSQPLAFNTSLIQSSLDHSLDMSNNNYFGHTGSDGSSPFQRMSADGFPWVGAAESIAAGQSSVEAALASLITDAGVPDLGHRDQLLSTGGSPYTGEDQTGVGVVMNGSGSYHNYYTIDSGYTSNTNPFLLGVAYNDTNHNGLYDNGEGLGGVTITATGTGGTFQTTTWSSGGYSLQLTPGTYTVTASGGSLGTPQVRTITVGSSNYRLNFTPASVNWPPQWVNLNLSTIATTTGVTANGVHEAFAIGTDNALYEREQNTDGSWGAWTSLGGGCRGQLAVARNAAGYLDVYVIGQDGQLWYRDQTGPGAFAGWGGLGGSCASLAAGTNADGTEQIFVVGAGDGALYTNLQTGNGGWTGWQNLGGGCTTQLAVARDASGYLDAYVIGRDGQLWYRDQTSRDSFAGWGGLGGSCKTLAAGNNADGTTEIYVVGAGDNALYTNLQTGNGGWTGWQNLGGGCGGPLTVARNSSGYLDAYVVGQDGELWYRDQTSRDNFAGWSGLGGEFVSVAAASDSSGIVVITGVGSDQSLRARSQTSPGVWG